jgi:hypothetical protein
MQKFQILALTFVFGFAAVSSLSALGFAEKTLVLPSWGALGVVVGGVVYCVARTFWYGALVESALYVALNLTIAEKTEPFIHQASVQIVRRVRQDWEIGEDGTDVAVVRRLPERRWGYKVLVQLGDTGERWTLALICLLCFVIIFFVGALFVASAGPAS